MTPLLTVTQESRPGCAIDGSLPATRVSDHHVNGGVDGHAQGEVDPQRESEGREAQADREADRYLPEGWNSQWMTRTTRPGRGYLTIGAVALPYWERI